MWPRRQPRPQRCRRGPVQRTGHRGRPGHRPADPPGEGPLAGGLHARAGKFLCGGGITPEWERGTGLRLRFINRGRGPNLMVGEGWRNTKGRAEASRLKTAETS
jgi:hypothetical protein